MRATAGSGSRGEWPGLAAFFGCNVLFAAGLYSHAFLYNFYLDALGLGEGVMGGAAAALTAGGLTALVPAGRVVDRWGPGRGYLGAAVLASAGLAAGAVSRTALEIYGAAFLAGAGTATWRVSMGPLLMRLATASTRTRAFSWNVAMLLASGAVWTAVSGAVPAWLDGLAGLSRLGGIRVALVIGAGGTLSAAVLLPALGGLSGVGAGSTGAVRDGRVTPNSTGGFADARDLDERAGAAMIGEAAGERLRDRLTIPADLAVAIVIVALWMLAAGLVLPFLNVWFMRVHGMDVGRIGLLFGVAQAITALIVFGSGDLAARVGTRRLLLLWAASFAPLLWLLGLATTFAFAVTVYLIQGFVAPATNPLIDQLLLERAPRSRRGVVSTWRNAATEFAGLVGAATGGALLEASSFGVLFAVAGAVAAAGAIGLAAGFRRGAGVSRSAGRPRLAI